MLRRAALLAIPALLATAAPAEAYRFAGKRWPGTVVPYAVEAPLYDEAVEEAARAWNRARIGISFRRVKPEHARLVIRYGRSRGARLSGCKGENGRAMLGWPGPYYTYSTIGFTGACRSARTRRLIAMHEMGHALGLDHDDRRCALMNSSIRVDAGIPRRCRGRRVAARLRHGPLPDDVRGARRLYSRPSPKASPSVARFNPDGTRALPRAPVTFSAGLRNSRLLYVWDFGDPYSGRSNNAIGLDAGHTFTAPGVYKVTLAVVDGDAVIAQRSRRMLISPQP